MPRRLTAQRRTAEKQFMRTLLATGQHLAKHAPKPFARSAATRVLRRLRRLSGML